MGNFGSQVDMYSPFGEATDDDQEIGRQDIERRLNTAPGTYRLDPLYGLLVSSYVNRPMTVDEVAAIPSEIEAQILLNTDMFSGCNCTVENADPGNPQGARMRFRLDVDPNVGGPWSFNLDAGELTTEVLTVGATA